MIFKNTSMAPYGNGLRTKTLKISMLDGRNGHAHPFHHSAVSVESKPVEVLSHPSLDMGGSAGTRMVIFG